MVKKSIAREYANALSKTVTKESFKVCIQNAMDFGNILKEFPKIVKVFENPAISKEKKENIVELIGKMANFDPTFVSFLKLLVEKRRISLLDEIAKELITLFDKSEGIVRGTIFTAQQLSQEEKEKIQKELEEKLKKKVILREEIRPEVLGGFKVQIGSKVFDATFANSLVELKNYLLKR